MGSEGARQGLDKGFSAPSAILMQSAYNFENSVM